MSDEAMERRQKHIAALASGERRTWSYEGNTCKAFTKSEARATFKLMLNLDRLPVGAKLEAV